MELYYVNSRNEKLDFTRFPYLVSDLEELADFSHDYTVDSTAVSFSDRPAEISLTLNISADTVDEYKRAVDRFYEIAELDVQNKTPGRLYYGEQYVNCYIVGSQKKDWCMGITYMSNFIRMVAMRPFWVLEKECRFKQGDIVSTDNKRYRGRYPYRYANGLTNSAIVNDHFAESNFRLIIYGPVLNPLIVIGGYPYQVSILLEEGEYLEIDSAASTVVKWMNTGLKINAFHNRNKANSVFRKIPSGYQKVTWTGKFDFDIILYEERSEPRCQL